MPRPDPAIDRQLLIEALETLERENNQAMNQMIADPSEYLSNSNRVFRTTQDQMRYLTERGQELLTKQQSITGALDLLRRGKAQAYLVDLVTTLPAKDATSI